VPATAVGHVCNGAEQILFAQYLYKQLLSLIHELPILPRLEVSELAEQSEFAAPTMP